MNNNSIRRKQRITALTLVLTMLMSGCGGKDNSKFELAENDNNELVACDDSYISSEYIDDYYVVEMYNEITKENEIFIAKSRGIMAIDAYFDVFTNLKIWEVGRTNTVLKYVKDTMLSDYIVALDLGQAKYSYDDMKNIYEVIKENYVYESNDSLCKRRILDDRI